MPDPVPAEASPLTCEYCENAPPTQVLAADVVVLGRYTTFTCGPCGDEQERHVRRLKGKLWRYQIAPLGVALAPQPSRRPRMTCPVCGRDVVRRDDGRPTTHYPLNHDPALSCDGTLYSRCRGGCRCRKHR